MLNYSLITCVCYGHYRLGIANSGLGLIYYYFCNSVFDLSSYDRYLFHNIHGIDTIYPQS